MPDIYTGVGSRSTPEPMLRWMTDVATVLSLHGWVLRSGGADGADTAFEQGVSSFGSAEIYLPWNGFNNRRSRFDGPSMEARRIAAEAHPAWERLGSGARSLHARNVHQVLGENLNSPSELVICWTPDGCETEAERTRETGGTATAIVVACRFGVPVYNMQKPGSFTRITEHLARLGVS